jgi:uncharacterized repeat protein (TIGR01451 family)
VGGTATSGVVTVTETPPTGLTIATMSGTNWTCNPPTCTRSDALAPSQSYEPITVTVNVSATAPASLTNVASVSGGGDTNNSNNSSSDPTTVSPAAAGPDLTIQKTHSVSFVQGQTGTYTLTVKNVGGAATSGAVTVTETPPSDLTVTAMSGTNWTCTPPTCARSDALAPSQSYEPITVTVNVSATAPASLTNVASVSGGGDTSPANNTASDPTTVSAPVAGPDLTIQKTHSGKFVQGQTGTYTLAVRNAGGTATSGVVTVTETPPTGLTVATMTGTGWTCNPPTCTRSDALAPNQSYEPITVTVSVSASAPASVTNVASVSGGGDTSVANNASSDATVVDPAAPIPTLNEWMFGVLAAVLALTAIWTIRRRVARSATP